MNQDHGGDQNSERSETNQTPTQDASQRHVRVQFCAGALSDEAILTPPIYDRMFNN